MEIMNAVIRSATLSTSDHGVLTGWVYLDYGESGQQGFGGYQLFYPGQGKDLSGLFIWRVLEVVGVTEWSHLEGRPVRARIEGGLVRSLGHFIKDDWFTPKEEFNAE